MSGSGGKEGRRIIVVKRKGGHGDHHHGGSWKVAYADFVTAMMAFFLVLWILGMDEGVKDIVQGYFTNPVGFRKAYSGGLTPSSSGNSPTNLGIRQTPMHGVDQQRIYFERTASTIAHRLREARIMGGLEADVEVLVTEQGLRIEMMDTGPLETFFETGSARVRPALAQVLAIIAPELAKLPHGIVVEGHTDARPFGSPGYSNWELSVDRANAARRALLAGGALEEARVAEVRGYAERKPRVPADPLDPRNRRITLLVPFLQGPDLRPLEGWDLLEGSLR